MMVTCIFTAVCQATWENVVSSVTQSGGSYSRLRKRRRGTWSLRPAWWGSSPCSPSLPVSPTATGEMILQYRGAAYVT